MRAETTAPSPPPLRTEIAAGVTTFLALSYILFVQPALLSAEPVGMDFGAVTLATCLSSALATAIMGLWARYPIALAPGMGINAYFAFVLVPAAASAGAPVPWQAALGVVWISGLLFAALTLLGVRERILHAVPENLRHAIVIGIGIFLAFLGLRSAGVVVSNPATGVALSDSLGSPDVWVFAAGLLAGGALHARRARGAILGCIAAATLTALALRGALAAGWLWEGAADSQLATRFALADSLVAWPPSLAPTFAAFDWRAALLPGVWPYIGIFLFVDLFDSMGTLLGVGSRAGLLEEGRLPRVGRALWADAAGTVAGAGLGTSTVTSYIESAAGVEEGGRTGVTALVVAALFLVAPFFLPLIAMVGSYPPLTAGALVMVGALMISQVRELDFEDRSELLPIFLIVIGIPLCFSIGDGIALGFISYPLLKLLSGRARDVPAPLWGLAFAMLVYFYTAHG